MYIHVIYIGNDDKATKKAKQAEYAQYLEEQLQARRQKDSNNDHRNDNNDRRGGGGSIGGIVDDKVCIYTYVYIHICILKKSI
jgi:hypothetical protein